MSHLVNTHTAPKEKSSSGTANIEEVSTSSNDDALILAEGYLPPSTRPFRLPSLLALGFSTSNTWLAVTGALVTGIANGGPVIYIYGSIFMFLIHLCVGASLGELASAYPNSGGQYYWVLKLWEGRGGAAWWGYVTGFTAWAGAVVTGASCSLLVAQGIMGCAILTHGHVVYERWMGFIVYQVVNALIGILNCWEHLLPVFSKASLYTSLFSMIIITITVLAVSSTKQPASFVFATYINQSGYTSRPLTILTGLLGVNWGFSCLDTVTHMSEEVPRPSINVPRAILGTVIIGFITSWIYSIAIFFSLTDIDAIIATPTLVPNLELFYQALRGSKAGAVVLETLVILTAAWCLMAIHTWQSRLMWSFARDSGLLGSGYLSCIGPKPFGTPLYAHLASCIVIAVLGCVYLGSSTGFNSLVTGGILMQYISYVIPVVMLMVKGRRLEKRGPFWLGRWGWAANGVLVSWASVALVFYSFPYVKPVTKDNMNYVSVVIVVFLVYATIYWIVRGRGRFEGVRRVRKEPEPAQTF